MADPATPRSSPPDLDWDSPYAPPSGDGARVAVIGAIAAVPLFLSIFVPGQSTFAIALGVIVLMWVGWSGIGRRALRGSSAAPLAEDDEPRLVNVVRGIAVDLGIDPPAVWVYDGPPNAFVLERNDGTIVVSRRLLRGYSRTELEAVAAHCLLRLRDGLRRERAAIFLGRFAAGPAACYARAYDVPAAAVTRYPPALMSAIEKAAPRGGRFAPLYFVPSGPGECAPAERMAVLADL